MQICRAIKNEDGVCKIHQNWKYLFLKYTNNLLLCKATWIKKSIALSSETVCVVHVIMIFGWTEQLKKTFSQITNNFIMTESGIWICCREWINNFSLIGISSFKSTQ